MVACIEYTFKFLRVFRRNKSGQDLIEYALLCAFIAFFVVGWLPGTMVPAFSTIWSNLQYQIERITGVPASS